MDCSIIEKFIRKQKVAFICSVDEEGFPNVKAMLKHRKIEGILRLDYFKEEDYNIVEHEKIRNAN